MVLNFWPVKKVLDQGVQVKNDPAGVLYVRRKVIFCDCNEDLELFQQANLEDGGEAEAKDAAPFEAGNDELTLGSVHVWVD